MRIYVTGGTGYIGSALCRRWVREGLEVRALVRPTSDTRELESLGVTCCEGDLLDRFSLREGMSGADWVVHAAAAVDPRIPEPEMVDANVQGSENVASLAFKLGVGRFLAISSIASFGGSPPDGSPATEDSPPQLPLPTGYSRTKRAGEEAIRRWAQEGLRVNVVYPSLVYGPPGKKMGSNYFLRQMVKGRFPAIVAADRAACWIFIDDLIEGIARVMARAEPGRDFLMSGHSTTIGDTVHLVCEMAEVAPPRWKLSVPMARLMVGLMSPLYRLRGHSPPLDREQVANLARHWNFDDARAREELDWRPRSLEEGLPPTLEMIRS